MAITRSHLSSYDKWHEHNLGQRVNTELVVFRSLSEQFPDCHITRTSMSKCDVLGYASAGFAEATAEHDAGFDAMRVYKPPANGIDKHQLGKLEDTVKFGRWHYTWKTYEYTIYLVQYLNQWAQPVNLVFILSPASPGTVKDGHHSLSDALVFAASRWTEKLHDEIYIFDDSQWTKDKKLFTDVQGCSWDDVILDPATKNHLIQDVQSFFDNQDVYKSLNVPWKRGVIFHGVPGNGKTISLKALINSLSQRHDPIPSLYVKNLYNCASPKYSIKDIFAHARRMAPCLLIFEDLDSLIEDESRSYFLNEVDGLESNDGILMIGSTNHLDRLDPAITKRPSRFDRKYHFKVPDEEQRVAYCRYWSRKFTDSASVDFPDEICQVIATLTEGFSFAYLKELFVASLLELARTATGGETEEVSTASDKVAVTSSNISVTDSIMIEHPEHKSETNDGEKPQIVGETARAAESPATEMRKKEMPLVHVPENVRDNRLLGIATKHARMLLEEMDSTEEGATKKRPEEGKENCQQKALADQMRLLARHNARVSVY
jgi:transitional endoplasmic reticulum ATPase